MAFSHFHGRAYMPYGKVGPKDPTMPYDPYRGHLGNGFGPLPYNQHFYPPPNWNEYGDED